MSPFDKASPAPRGVLYLATFNATERAVIAASPELRDAIRSSSPAEWPAIIDEHQAAQRAAISQTASPRPIAPAGALHERQWRYAQSVLTRELRELASMPSASGRNDRAFRLVARLGRWVHHGIIARDQFTADVLDACERNGLVREDGRKAVLATIASGLACSATDTLPELEVRT